MLYKRPKMHLIIQSYPERNKERYEELMESLKKNLNNRCIDYIHDIQEPNTIVSDEIRNNKKMIITEIDTTKTKHTTHIIKYSINIIKSCECRGNQLSKIKKMMSCDTIAQDKLDKLDKLFDGNLKNRLTFQYAFEYVKSNIPIGDIVIISNNDILFDDNDYWYNIDRDLFCIDSNIACCITRWELDKEGKKFWYNPYAQCCMDVWCFKNDGREIPNTNFGVGNCPNCDGAMINRFSMSGYRIFNDVYKYKVFHNDIVRKRDLKMQTMIITDNTDLCCPDEGIYSCCCPFQDFDVALFNKTIKTNSSGEEDITSYSNCCEYLVKLDINEHCEKHKIEEKILILKIKEILGNTKGENEIKLNSMMKKYGNSENKLKEWKLFDRFENMTRQIYYFVNIWNLGWYDWMGHYGFDLLVCGCIIEFVAFI